MSLFFCWALGSLLGFVALLTLATLKADERERIATRHKVRLPSNPDACPCHVCAAWRSAFRGVPRG